MIITPEQRARIAFDAAHDNYKAAWKACVAAGEAVADAKKKLDVAWIKWIKLEAPAAASEHGEAPAQGGHLKESSQNDIQSTP
ncbi:MAG: hypothetical protein LBP92_05910 [Deltaproteobacteria bacterium]|jgi:hypothetical protein|nr:hypothetical protein [Deltaproteobacteria bacterium]